MVPLSIWIAFHLFIFAMLALDLGVFQKKSHAVSIKEAIIWSGIWFALAALFNVGIYYLLGSQPALEFATGYLVEKFLSVDNLFVFLLIFSYFKVPAAYQHRVLFWGVFGAIAMRALFISLGVTLIQNFHAIIYVFGAFLIITGAKMLFPQKETNLDDNPLLKILKKYIPVSDKAEGDAFFVRKDGCWLATPLLLVLILIEFTDVVFAVDSVPAILAISSNPFIVYTSNIFAILGLRSLYFALSGIMDLFHYLKYALSAILIFVGVKMLIADMYKIPVLFSLGAIAALLSIAVVASLVWPKKESPSV